MNKHSEERLALLYPELARRWRVADGMLLTLGYEVEVTQGLRNWAEQGILWQKGRNQDGSLIDPVHHADVVTNAKPGESWHNYALALDIGPDDPTKPGYQPDYDDTHPIWNKIVEIGESVGLKSGKSWHDKPHFELTGPWGSKPTEDVLYLFREGGMKAIFDELDSFYGIPTGG
jgi:hypothetical protein